MQRPLQWASHTNAFCGREGMHALARRSPSPRLPACLAVWLFGLACVCAEVSPSAPPCQAALAHITAGAACRPGCLARASWVWIQRFGSESLGCTTHRGDDASAARTLGRHGCTVLGQERHSEEDGLESPFVFRASHLE